MRDLPKMDFENCPTFCDGIDCTEKVKDDDGNIIIGPDGKEKCKLLTSIADGDIKSPYEIQRINKCCGTNLDDEKQIDVLINLILIKEMKIKD